MDIEEEIKALQLDSSEDTVMANAEDGNHDFVKPDEKPDEKDEVKEKEKPAPEVLQDEVEENKKRHLNVVFIGHVDAGKSTAGGQILFLSGQVDDRTIQKYEKEAKDKSRESW